MRSWFRTAILVVCALRALTAAAIAEGAESFTVQGVGRYLECWGDEGRGVGELAFFDTAGVTVVHPDSVETQRYDFPGWFRKRLEEGGFGSGEVPGEMAKWSGWVKFEDEREAVFLIPKVSYGRGEAGSEIELSKVQLPEECLSFGFLEGKGIDTWMFVLTADRLLKVNAEGNGQAEYEAVFEKQKLIEDPALLGLRGELYDWVMDVDGDGRDDVLIPSGKDMDVYLQEADCSLVHAGRVAFDRPTVYTGVYINEASSLPGMYRGSAPMWLEPSEIWSLPNLVAQKLHEKKRMSLLIYKQEERGRFVRYREEEQRGWLFLRQVLKCGLTRKHSEGILVNAVRYVDRRRVESVVIWKGRTLETKALVLRNTPLVVWPVDVDKDGVIELFVLDTPPLRKMVDRATEGLTQDFKLTGKFMGWVEGREAWGQVLKTFSAELSPFGQQWLLLGTNPWRLSEKIEERVVVGHDMNGDGYGDIAWVEKPERIHVLLLRKRGRKFEALSECDVSAPRQIAEISALGSGEAGELLIRCGADGNGGEDERDEDHGGYEYYIMRRR